MLRGDGRARWPRHVAVRPTRPPARVAGTRLLVTWVGHATVLIQTGGLNILTDPIWSERASPLGFAGPKRVRAPGIAFDDLPRIDLVLVSHNHYDHLDLPTLQRLWSRDRPAIVTSLGNDAILERRGIPAVAADWGATIPLSSRRCRATAGCAPGGAVVIERVHHWGSRWGSDRNRALWSGFTLKLPGGNIFFAGDTGWGGGGWARAARQQGSYRLAILPIGAYEPRDVMADSHMNPAEAVAAFEALGAARALGMHWGTFQLTFEAIDDPPRRLASALEARGIAKNRFVATEAGRTFAVP
jgi:L-ascorbate metabolism protein UlaG (beta-lactamase superfamily)